MMREAVEKYLGDWPEPDAEIWKIRYNCAEATLRAANECYALGLGPMTLKAIAPFGGGFYLERTCGIVSGGLAAIGVMFAQDHPYASARVKEMAKKWVTAFEERFGSSVCEQVKQGRDCRELVRQAAELLDAVLVSE